MKLKTLFIMSVAALCSMACSKNDDVPTVADIAGTYEGYTLASCAYFENSCSAGEVITVTENADGTAAVAFTSDSWGEFSISSAVMSRNGDVYTLSGSGRTQMGMGGNTSSYDCMFTATIDSDGNARMKFEVAAVMGGMTIEFATGDAPADLLLAGTYDGYTSAGCAYFENRYTDGESLTMTAAGDGTLSLAFESASWGRFEVASVDIARDGNIYTLTGNGSVAMGMGGATSSYDFTLTGSVNASRDDYSFKFEVPAVMGGLTITLFPGSAPSESEK
ncbi:MAG: calycin-like domain-containing protein [Alistipes sp.]|nr:calycin-like domain-containing protein [Alistipes sp.]